MKPDPGKTLVFDKTGRGDEENFPLDPQPGKIFKGAGGYFTPVKLQMKVIEELTRPSPLAALFSTMDPRDAYENTHALRPNLWVDGQELAGLIREQVDQTEGEGAVEVRLPRDLWTEIIDCLEREDSDW